MGGEEAARNVFPTPEQIIATNIPCLDTVVEGSSHCEATAAGIVRTAVHDTTLLGDRIPKVIDVFMLTNGPGYMAPGTINETIPEHALSESSGDFKNHAVPLPDISDTIVFKPERWIKTDEKGVQTFRRAHVAAWRWNEGLLWEQDDFPGLPGDEGLSSLPFGVGLSTSRRCRRNSGDSNLSMARHTNLSICGAERGGQGSVISLKRYLSSWTFWVFVLFLIRAIGETRDNYHSPRSGQADINFYSL